MNEKLKILENGHSLTKRIWIRLNNMIDKNCIDQTVYNQIKETKKYAIFEFHFILEDSDKKTIEMLKYLMDLSNGIRVGYERKVPQISVYLDYQLISKQVISEINKYDIFKPGIMINAVIRDKKGIKFITLEEKRRIAFKIKDIVMECINIGISIDIILFVQRKVESFPEFIELSKIIYTIDTSVNIPLPLIEISHVLDLDKQNTLLLKKYVKDNHMSIVSPVCGVINCVTHYIENMNIPTKIVPLLGCGAGRDEIYIESDGSCKSCIYGKSNKNVKEIVSICKECEYFSNCTGCLASFTNDNECMLKKYYKIIEC